MHLAESYGPDVGSLYYYVMNMKRLVGPRAMRFAGIARLAGQP